jgi:quinol monooxygenase YgiN
MGKPRKKTRAKVKRSASPARKSARTGVTLLVALHARQGREEALEKELRALVGPTRAERGCIAYDLHVSSEQPGLFLLREIWASLKHHARHWDTPHMKRWAERKNAVMANREASFWKQIV